MRTADPDAYVPIVFEGFVFEPDGAPAEGAVVVSSAGGKAVVDWNGSFRLEARVPIDAQNVQITAVGEGGKNLVASAKVDLSTSIGLAQVGTLLLAQGATCLPSWLPTFGAQPGTDDYVFALTVFDDGSGPALYVGGRSMIVGSVEASRIAKWDGSSWSALGTGTDDDVKALAVFDDGSGPALYAGGGFGIAGGVAANNIAKWDGSSWTALGSGMNGGSFGVYALAVFDDGGGPALYAGGNFTTAGGITANRIAKWNGSSWSALGTGANDDVKTLVVFDDGSGPALFAGGDFSSPGGRIAKWNGSSWTTLGSITGTSARVEALTVYDAGGGPALYAGGGFTSAGGTAVNNIARWNGGSSWAALGSGIIGSVYALTAYDDGGGPALYAGGNFTTAGGITANRIAKWNGSSWAALGSGLGVLAISSSVLTVYDDGGGPTLYVGGAFLSAGGAAANRIAKWDGSSWSALGGGGSNDYVYALTVFDEGSGPALYAGGRLTDLGGVAVNRIGKWDGSTWTALGTGMSGEVRALTFYDDGSGPALYAGGFFVTAGGVPANRIAKWDGSSWSALGSGMNNPVYALMAFDDGSGPALYAGGSFTTAGGVAADHVARWNGSSWSALGSVPGSTVQAFAVFDDGGGPALHMGGTNGVGVRRWNGSSWTSLGLGAWVYALAVYDDGSGPTLYAGCPNAVFKRGVGSWPIVGGVWSGTGSTVFALTVFDDGSGPALYAGGFFTNASGVAANHIAKWDGSSWGPVGSGMNNEVDALTVFDDGGSPALFAGGEFGIAFDSGDSYLAKWGCLDTTPPEISCPLSVLAVDAFSGPPGEVVYFSVTATDDRDPSPSLLCTPPSGSFFPRGTTLVTCTATDASGNQSTCDFPVTVRIKAEQRNL